MTMGPSKPETNLIFTVQGYEKRTDQGQLIDVTIVEIFADSEKEAIARAKKLIKHKEYRVQRIFEKDVCTCQKTS